MVAKKVRDATAFIEADTRRTRALFMADKMGFEKAIGAMQTNKEDGYVTMVLERRKSE